MKKETLYLDTSVISAYYDERDPYKLESTRIFWRKLDQYEVYISEIVQNELRAIGETELRDKVFSLTKSFILSDITEEEEFLCKEYLREGVIPQRYENDGLQIAIASVHAIDYIVSWNFEHIVKVKTRRMVNLINQRYGYKPVEIVAPFEL